MRKPHHMCILHAPKDPIAPESTIDATVGEDGTQSSDWLYDSDEESDDKAPQPTSEQPVAPAPPNEVLEVPSSASKPAGALRTRPRCMAENCKNAVCFCRRGTKIPVICSVHARTMRDELGRTYIHPSHMCTEPECTSQLSHNGSNKCAQHEPKARLPTTGAAAAPAPKRRVSKITAAVRTDETRDDLLEPPAPKRCDSQIERAPQQPTSVSRRAVMGPVMMQLLAAPQPAQPAIAKDDVVIADPSGPERLEGHGGAERQLSRPSGPEGSAFDLRSNSAPSNQPQSIVFADAHPERIIVMTCVHCHKVNFIHANP